MTGSKIVINGKSVKFGTIYVNSSGTELLIIVTAPTGSTVTASKDGKVYTSIEESGTWNIKVHEYGTYTVKATLGDEAAQTTVDVGPVHVNLSYVPQVFGVMWDSSNPSTALTRLTSSNDDNGLVNTNITTEPVAAVGTDGGSSLFDAFMPWRGMEEYNIVGNDVFYKKGDNRFSRTEHDTMVYIPEFYYYVVNSGVKRYWYISDKPKEGFEKHPGSGRYVGRYNTVDGYISKSNLTPLVNITRNDARVGSHNKGANWWQYDYATWCAIWLLYLVEYADWDSQKKIGRGIVDATSASAAFNNGGTDAMTYHTGCASGTDGLTAVQYRWIENLWGNVYDWVDGINFSDRIAYISLNNANFADDTTSGYGSSGIAIAPSNWIGALGHSINFPWGFLPSAGGGSDATYIPDYVFSEQGLRVFFVGGCWLDVSRAGLFICSTAYASSGVSTKLGSRLIYIPNEVAA